MESEFRFDDFSTAEIKKKSDLNSGIKTESEFRFQWGSQKLEPEIGIPNLGYVVAVSSEILRFGGVDKLNTI